MPERQQGGNILERNKIKRMVGIAILIAIVIVLQLLGQFIKLGPMVSVSLVLLPIVVGAAVYGPAAGAILGLAFSVVVLLQPDTAFFYGMNVFGTGFLKAYLYLFGFEGIVFTDYRIGVFCTEKCKRLRMSIRIRNILAVYKFFC